MKVIVRNSNPSGSFLQIAAFPDDGEYMMPSAFQYKCKYEQAEEVCKVINDFLKLDPMIYTSINIEGITISKNGPDRITINSGYSMVTVNDKAAKNLMYEIKRLYKIK